MPKQQHLHEVSVVRFAAACRRCADWLPVRVVLRGANAATQAHVARVCFFFVLEVDPLVPLFVPLAPWSAGGGVREDVALSYVYADSGCVAASWLCVL